MPANNDKAEQIFSLYLSTSHFNHEVYLSFIPPFSASYVQFQTYENGYPNKNLSKTNAVKTVEVGETTVPQIKCWVGLNY